MKKTHLFFKCDFTSIKDLEKFTNNCSSKKIYIDAAINCAYPTSKQWGKSLENLKPKELKKDLFNQLGGAILFSKIMIKLFRTQGYGHLIHMSSIQGAETPKFEHYKGTKMTSPIEYTAIKSGIIAITKYLAKYCKGEKIRVNCISPGGILFNQPKVFLSKYRKTCSSKGMLNAEDINGTLIYLLSDNSKYVNGQNIIVDDGWSL